MNVPRKTVVTSRSTARRLAEVAGRGLVYYAAGKIALPLSIPPGYATAVWPAAGLALGCMLLFDYGVWPGILLGSFFVNVFTSLDTSTATSTLESLLAPAAIGLGAALQAIAGAFLVRRFVGYPTALDDERKIIRFLVLGGPVSCLVNTTLGVTSLFFAGHIPLANYLFNW